MAANCTGYVIIMSGDEKALQEAVARIGPISVAIDATKSFQHYESGASHIENHKEILCYRSLLAKSTKII